MIGGTLIDLSGLFRGRLVLRVLQATRLGLVRPVVGHGRVEVLPAVGAEGLPSIVGELLVKTAQEALIVDTHGLEEAEFELLPISTQLCCQSVSLALELLLSDVERAQIIQRLLTVNDFAVVVLVFTDHAIDLDFVFGHHGHHFVALGLALPAITLVFEGHVDGVLVIRVRILIVLASLISVGIGPGVSVLISASTAVLAS